MLWWGLPESYSPEGDFFRKRKRITKFIVGFTCKEILEFFEYVIFMKEIVYFLLYYIGKKLLLGVCHHCAFVQLECHNSRNLFHSSV